jgi:hypothetical protein
VTQGFVPAPLMIIVVGPPGGGKSTHLQVKNVDIDSFNSDDRAAQLNAGSYQNIPVEVRNASGQQLQQFIESHIASRRSFVLENALRTDTCFQQIRRAKEMGFQVRMNYLAAGPVEEHPSRDEPCPARRTLRFRAETPGDLSAQHETLVDGVRGEQATAHRPT